MSIFKPAIVGLNIGKVGLSLKPDRVELRRDGIERAKRRHVQYEDTAHSPLTFKGTF